jgi:hypothetical protein
LKPDELAVVGDRIYTDMAMARAAGAVGVLVLTGETTRASRPRSAPAAGPGSQRCRRARTLLAKSRARPGSRSMLDDRAQRLATARGEPLDVLVIGGGIVGSGVARDAAMRGCGRFCSIATISPLAPPAAPAGCCTADSAISRRGRIGLGREGERRKSRPPQDRAASCRAAAVHLSDAQGHGKETVEALHRR